MRCFACDCELTDYEATLRSATTNQYLDMCSDCISASGIAAVSFSTQVSNNIIIDTEDSENAEL